jgi:hypothetical protein
MTVFHLVVSGRVRVVRLEQVGRLRRERFDSERVLVRIGVPFEKALGE